MASDTNIVSYWPEIAFAVNLIISGFVGFIGAWVKLSTLQVKITTLEKDVDTIKTQNIEIIQKLAYLQGGLERDREHTREYVKSQSPLALTDQGKAILLDSKGKDFIDNKKSLLIDEIKSKSPKTAYDVQEISKKIIENHSNDDDFNSIKDFVFFKGERLENLIEVMGIYLRDIALKELGFNISDIKD